MKLALCVWNGRLAPVFDCAGTLLVLDGELRTEHHIAGLDLVQRARFLTEQGVKTLICGALSREAQLILTREGIQLVPFRSGAINEILEALSNNRIQEATWAMPGCAYRNRRRNGQGPHCRRHKHEQTPPNNGFNDRTPPRRTT
jgi:predicted Fe-Mo cluster-binding NifX family protein